MRFGLLYEAQRPFKGTDIDWNKLYKETLEQCVLADKVGFDNLWFVEHHFLTGFSGSPCPEDLLGALSQMASASASCRRTIRSMRPSGPPCWIS
jgi:alkanesulfonate monooxygenase SsuD/methylene tetrahydromethanopterin reductase-like flavin-dependent oxidoreductase (luciferase family)